jgi:3-phosphoglycerate kinase
MPQRLQDLDVKGRRVLVRVDFNVPLDDAGNVTDATRIRAALPTIRHILDRGGRCILMSHLGRPKGRDPKASLKPAAEALERELGRPVSFIDDCVGYRAEQAVAAVEPGGVLLLENVRFYTEEEGNDADFVRKLAAHGDCFVNDAFGSAHRAHASTVGPAQYLPSAPGFLMEKELEYLGRALEKPARPFVVILGGAKVSDKIGVIRNLFAKVDALLIGGAMAYAFLKAQGVEVGDSKLEKDRVGTAKELLEMAAQRNIALHLPVDHVIAKEIGPSAATEVCPAPAIPAGWKGGDVGPATARRFADALARAKTVVWNGPLGVAELKPFSSGTCKTAEAVVRSGALSIIGGGDTAAVLEKYGWAEKMSHVSTGGGASLEFLEGRELPGVKALK